MRNLDERKKADFGAFEWLTINNNKNKTFLKRKVGTPLLSPFSQEWTT
jgi:hypothetical protein